MCAYLMQGCRAVAPLLCMNQTTMIAISTLTSSVNFYSRLIKMRNKTTGAPLFNIFQVLRETDESSRVFYLIARCTPPYLKSDETATQVELACPECVEKGMAAQCVHRLHLIPRWQSSDRHTMLKTVMQDRPDLIESELAGLAFDAAQTVFRAKDLDIMFSQPAPALVVNEDVHVFIDPAAGGPGSDYAILSVTRHKGLVTVSFGPERIPEYRAQRPGGGLRHGQQEAPVVRPRLVRRPLRGRGRGLARRALQAWRVGPRVGPVSRVGPARRVGPVRRARRVGPVGQQARAIDRIGPIRRRKDLEDQRGVAQEERVHAGHGSERTRGVYDAPVDHALLFRRGV